MRRDIALAAALFAIAVGELLLRGTDALALQLAVSALICWSLPLRQRSPLGVVVVQATGFGALGITGQEIVTAGVIPPLLICLFTAATSLPLRQAILALLLLLVSVYLEATVDEDLGDALYVVGVFILPPWLAGRMMRTRRRQIEQLEQLNAALARERERAQALAAEAERGRLAREMHDVLSHGMSLMVLQAGAGPRLLAQDPAAARETFRSIRATGERARRELAAAVVDRAADDALEPLVAAVPGARLRVEGDPATLSPGVRLAIRRIVQEALTNAVKHGSPGRLDVDLAVDATVVEVRVSDDGDGASPLALEGAGRGLIGMRERAAAYGGTLEAGPRESGGFEVRARLPAHPA